MASKKNRQDILSAYGTKTPYKVSDLAANLLNLTALSDTRPTKDWTVLGIIKQADCHKKKGGDDESGN